MIELLSRLRTRVSGSASDEILIECLEDAKAMCLGYMQREEMPEGCESALLRTAVAVYNRIGIEGQISHSEGGVSIVVDSLPQEVKAALRPFRLAKTG